MYLLIVFLALLTAKFLAYAFGKSIVITRPILIFFGILLLCIVILFRLYSFRLSLLFGKRVVFLIYFLILFLGALFMYFLRVSFFSGFLANFLVMGFLPLPLPSSPNSPGEDYSTMMAENPPTQAEGAQPAAPAQAPVAAPEQLPVGQQPFNRDLNPPRDFQGNPIDLNAPPVPELPGNEEGVPREPDLETLPRGEGGLSRAERARQPEDLDYIRTWEPKKPHAALEEGSSSAPRDRDRDLLLYKEYRNKVIFLLADEVSEILKLEKPIKVGTINSIVKHRIKEDGTDLGLLTPFFKLEGLGVNHELIQYILRELEARNRP